MQTKGCAPERGNIVSRTGGSWMGVQRQGAPPRLGAWMEVCRERWRGTDGGSEAGSTPRTDGHGWGFAGRDHPQDWGAEMGVRRQGAPQDWGKWIRVCRQGAPLGLGGHG